MFEAIKFILRKNMAQKAVEYVVEYECPMCQCNWTQVLDSVVQGSCPRCETIDIEPLESFILEL